MVTFTFFTFKGVAKRWWAFGQMGRRSFRVGVAEGLNFAKMLGTGGGNGFSIFPDFGRYGWLGVWDSEVQARDFFKNNPMFLSFSEAAESHFTVFAQPVMAHGLWDGQQPFVVSGNFDPEKPIAVLTRATIRTKYLLHFWQYVPRVSRSIEQFSANTLFSAGVGELPLIQQATFSIWQSGKAMMDYAYKSPFHAEVVKKTRELGWYDEELFARFTVIDYDNVPFK
jgi:hypothetical protein